MAQYRSRWTGEVIDDAVEKAKNITYLTIGEDAQGAFAKAEAVYGQSPLYAIDTSTSTIYECTGKTGNHTYNFAYSNAVGLVTVMLTANTWQEPAITLYATRERVGNVVAIYENGFTASRSIAKGQYVVWETMLSFGDNILYTADVDIATGTRLSANGSGKNLTAVSDGGLNDLKSAITKVETDLASIHATGTTNTTGATITAGTYFYLNGALVRAKADIAVNATFTSGTNYETVTAGGLNALPLFLYGTSYTLANMRTPGIYYGEFTDSPLSESSYGMVIVSGLPNLDYAFQLFIGNRWNGNFSMLGRISSNSTSWNAWKTIFASS